MWQNAHSAYLESRILSAEPLELVRMLYQAGVEAVSQARRHLAAGEIRERAGAISRAAEILIELETSLDCERGGEISQNLARLYEYMRHRLAEAHLEQRDSPLGEVLELMTTLRGAWEGLRTPEAVQAAPAPSPWAQPVLESGECVGAGSHAWSL